MARPPHEPPVYMRGRRHASVPERMFFASEPSSSESQMRGRRCRMGEDSVRGAARFRRSAPSERRRIDNRVQGFADRPARPGPLQPLAPRSRRRRFVDQYRCGAVFYKFCTRPRREFFFSHAANACVPVGSNPAVQLCNRGANRYASLEDCSFDCVRTPHPSSRCFRTDLFTTCSSDDIVNGSTTWFFDGSGCHMWNFPSGQCPSFDADLFTSLAQCRTRCLPPEGLKTKSVVTEPVDRAVPANSYTCSVPRPSICTGRQLRFPVFFQRALGPEYRHECLSAGLVADTDHRCLTGRNKFRTQRDCENACVRSLEVNKPTALALLE
ncbi:hypothetical protein MRX96_001463 [Rhipicephalus microplus]